MTDPIAKTCRYCGCRTKTQLIKKGWYTKEDQHYVFECGTQVAPVIDSTTGDGMWWSISDKCAEKLRTKFRELKKVDDV